MIDLDKLLDKRGRLSLIASLRLAEMDYEKATDIIVRLIHMGLFHNTIEAWEQVVDQVCDESHGRYGVCEPAPMSDDVLDSGVHYLTINRQLLGI